MNKYVKENDDKKILISTEGWKSSIVKDTYTYAGLIATAYVNANYLGNNTAFGIILLLLTIVILMGNFSKAGMIHMDGKEALEYLSNKENLEEL